MNKFRLLTLRFLVIVFALVITARLFYWQVINNQFLTAAAQDQRTANQLIEPERGKILASDDFALITNEPNYVLFAYRPQLESDPFSVSQKIAPILLDPHPISATEAAKPLSLRIGEKTTELNNLLTQTDKSWIALQRNLTHSVMKQIDAFNITGLGFDEYSVRDYPEASMSAHVLGFVGRNESGSPQGYFGLEGYYDRELKGRQGMLFQETDATGQPILIGLFKHRQARDGRTLKTHLNRAIQHLVETKLRDAIGRYGAKSGEILVMDPYSGAILAMAAWPAYDPINFVDYDPVLYKNPLIANSYEPGSTFKTLVMASAIDAGVITPETLCDDTCAGPVSIGKYAIRTWNNQYFPGQTMNDVLARSDNTGMVFVAFRLGKDKFIDYLHKFGIGELTGIDLQEESTPRFRSTWGDIDLATSSFGQGIAVSGIQMATAISVIANGGELVEPHVVSQVIGDESVTIPPKIKTRVISPETAATVTQMMVNSAHHGEAQWAVLKHYQVAGKTGTAQVPIAGHYDADKTIASFVGFAPAHNPKFTMIVKLTEPESSQWASETAAPLWFNLAYDLLTYLNVPPEN